MSGLPTVPASAPMPTSSTSQIVRVRQAWAAHQRPRRYRREDMRAFRASSKEGGQEVERAAARAGAGGRGRGGGPRRVQARAQVAEGGDEVGPQRGHLAVPPCRGGAARPDPEGGLGRTGQTRGVGRDEEVGGALGQAAAQPALEPVEPGVQLDEDEPLRVRRGLTGRREHRDPLDQGVVAGVGDHGQGAVEHVLVGRAGLEPVAHGGEEGGDARGEHRLDRGEVVEEGAARDPGAVGDRLGGQALEAALAHERVGGRGERPAGVLALAAAQRATVGREAVAQVHPATVRPTCTAVQTCTRMQVRPSTAGSVRRCGPWSRTRHRSRARRRWCAASASPSSVRTT